MNKITIQTLEKHKNANSKFACITAYDSTTAWAAESAEIDLILVGDTLGMVIQGKIDTLDVSIEDMEYHIRAVSRGCNKPMIMADMPFMAARTLDHALDGAMRLMQAGAHIIKFEGGKWLSPIIIELRKQGVPVCAHMGLTPQHINSFGGFKVQATREEEAQLLIDEAKALELAGASVILLECIPRSVTQTLVRSLNIPTIGIGAGSAPDGQILVFQDLMGLYPNKPARFAKNYLELSEPPSIVGALKLFKEEVEMHQYPEEKHSFKGVAL